MAARAGEREKSQQFDALRQIALELVAETDIERLLTTILRHAIDLLDGDDGAFFQYDPDQDRIEWQVAVNAQFSSSRLFLHRGEGAAGRAWASNQVFQVADHNHWAGRSPPFTVFPDRSIISAPLALREEFLGVLPAGVYRQHTFSTSDDAVREFFASHAAVAIHK